MDVVFVSNINLSSSEIGIPMGLLSLASILELKDYKVKVVDFNVSFYRKLFEDYETLIGKVNKMTELLIAMDPKIISFYTMCDTYHLILFLAKRIRAKRPNIRIILGGPQATLTAQETLEKFDFINVIGLGEGESYIEELISILLREGDLKEVQGIAFKKSNGNIIINPSNQVCDLNKMPYLNYNLINIEEFTTISLDVGRGCPFSCKFCSSKTFFRQKYRMKSPERLLNEIRLIKEQYGITTFRFVHDLFTVDKKFIIDFCKKLKISDLNIEWYCSARLDTLNKEIIDALHHAGCVNIFLGIETGSPRMQKEINKNLKLSRLLDMVDYIQLKNIRLSIAFIFGFPNETLEDINQTLKMILALYRKKVYMVQLNIWTPLPKTEFTNEFLEELVLNLSGSSMTGDNPLLLGNEWISNIIKGNKAIFPQYYHLLNEVNLKTTYLDKFMNDFFRFFYDYLSRTYQIILKHYEDNILEWFLDFKAVNPEFYKLCNYYKNSDWKISLKKIQLLKKFIENIPQFREHEELLIVFEEENIIYKIGFLKSMVNGKE